MKKELHKTICMGGLLAALYIVTTAINPIGYGIIQLRLSAIISIIPFYRRQYRIPCIAAVAIANMASPLGVFDVAVGILLWTLAYYVVDYLICNVYTKCAVTAVLSGVLIGAELSAILNAPFLYSFVSITISQGIVFAIAVVVLSRLARIGVI